MSDDRPDGAENDAKVEAKGPVLDVINVEGATLFEADIAATRDLGEASEAGFDSEEKGAVAVMMELARDEGARPDERNITLQDVKKLGEFVERRGAEKTSEFSDAGVFVDHVAIVTVFFDEAWLADFLESFLGGKATEFGLHGAELIDFDAAIVAGQAGVGVENWGARVHELLDDIDN